MARGKTSRAYRDLQDTGSCGQGTCKLRAKNEQIWFRDEGDAQTMHFMLLVKHPALWYISVSRADARRLNSKTANAV